MAEGYDKLASLVGRYDQLAMFRQFAALNTKNLFYMQAELVHDEAELDDIVQEDKRSTDQGKASYHASWNALKEPLRNGKPSTQLRKVMEVREKLDKYNAALIQYAQVRSFEKPTRADLTFMREWLNRREGGDFFLKGNESDPWKVRRTDDLILPSMRHKRRDCLAQWISDHTVPWFHWYFGHWLKDPVSDDTCHGIWDYDDKLFVAIGNALCTALSSLLPSVSIFVLYYLGSPVARLIASMAFTVFFSLTLSLVVQARRAEVFAATTAFAAIQVVFVVGTNFYASNGGSKSLNASHN